MAEEVTGQWGVAQDDDKKVPWFRWVQEGSYVDRLWANDPAVDFGHYEKVGLGFFEELEKVQKRGRRVQ